MARQSRSSVLITTSPYNVGICVPMKWSICDQLLINVETNGRDVAQRRSTQNMTKLEDVSSRQRSRLRQLLPFVVDSHVLQRSRNISIVLPSTNICVAVLGTAGVNPRGTGPGLHQFKWPQITNNFNFQKETLDPLRSASFPQICLPKMGWIRPCTILRGIHAIYSQNLTKTFPHFQISLLQTDCQ